ncbi:MAG: hypothetical protein CVT92_04405 [Bacteroidetes bacterium HGW-Bacteroidetes-1]|jgi:hypothetical protein|nr:MAG: hypothetical protein CVT92_04405 [Bacteroidetes bacterium HGW-Bacteroidetes-1]
MSKTISIFLLSFTLLTVLSCNKKEDDKPVGTLQLSSIKVGSSSLNLTGSSTDIAIDSDFILSFSAALDANAANQSITLSKGTMIVPITGFLSEDGKQFTLTPSNAMEFNSEYVINIAESLKGANGESFPGIQVHFTTEMSNLELVSIKINNKDFENPLHPKDVQFDDLKIEITFSDALESENISQHFSLFPNPGIQVTLSEDKKTVTVTNTGDLDYYRKHSFQISSSLQSTHEANYTGYSNYFITGLDPSNKFPLISDEALLDLVQLQTFKYFWDFAHPSSGMTRERNTSGDVVTVGGSGFGIMAIPIGIERGFITRQQGISHLDKVTDFLSTADRFHGVWPHWLNGNTGQVYPFSTNDNGGDLVETSFMAAGLMTVRQYLDPTQSEELLLINRINTLLSEIEWDWYTRGGQDVLYWHWSPNLGWVMNMQVRGYNEALITYFMAATSTTFPIEASVYHKGWANNGAIANGRSFYGIPLPVGYDYGGPLFFSHYSFLGLNPTGLEDQYANYWTQNVNHSLINREHCVLNPRGHLGYSADCWGLTASDEPTGYGVHEPTRDNGTITPSAALSSIPYTPEESMDAMRHFYFILGDKLWGEYGFKDAFNPDISWWASSYLVIDQGPIIIMIENHRTGLCWDLFMSAPEVQAGMNKLGFSR